MDEQKITEHAAIVLDDLCNVIVLVQVGAVGLLAPDAQLTAVVQPRRSGCFEAVFADCIALMVGDNVILHISLEVLVFRVPAKFCAWPPACRQREC